MHHRSLCALCGSVFFNLWLLALLFTASPAPAATFRVATYNVETYLDVPAATRPAKSAAAKTAVRHSLLALKPDVVALEEMGAPSALAELRHSLKADGLDLPYSEHVGGFDTNIHVALLSRFPFTDRRPHTNDDFLLGGRRFHVSRGFAEVDLRVTPDFSLTLIAAHLKSRRTIAAADEAELRLEEAKLLRALVDTRLAANPNLNLIVLGDFNDNPDSPSTRMILGKGRARLIDTRPAESNADESPNEGAPNEPRRITWTHYFAKDETYSRIDYILLSPALARAWVTNESRVLRLPDWGAASDHRPVLATFDTARAAH